MSKANKEQKDYLNNTAKTGKIEKIKAMGIATLRKFRNKHKAKYIRVYEKAIVKNKTKVADIVMDRILDADDISNSKALISIYNIQDIQARINELEKEINDNTDTKDSNIEHKYQEAKEELKEEQKIFEVYVYDDMVSKVDDPEIVNSTKRTEGMLTTLTLCLSYYPESIKIKSLINKLMFEVNCSDNFDELAKESYKYEIDQVSEFNKLNKVPYISYDPAKFEDLSKSEDYTKYGLYKMR